MSGFAMNNSAFVFIKPAANTTAVQNLVKSTLESKGCTITAEGEFTGPQIDAYKLIDQHYYAIASKATLLAPKDIPVPAAKFQEFFGLSYETALSEGLVYNAIDACTYLGVDAMGLDELWGSAKKVKLGGGFYCGIIEAAGKAPIYTFNAFFMSMRSKFVAPDASIHYYVVEFPASSLSWADFRGKVLGPTDPTKAPVDSLRGAILKDWEALGLGFVPNVGENSVHASASPFEGLAERMNWLQADPAADVFGSKLVEYGVPVPLIKEWSVDPQVNGKSIFDQLEDMDAAECLQKIVDLSLYNTAFVFIKPAANTPAVQKLVKSTLESKGCTITVEGEFTGPQIDAHKLIDQHYYAIASKATLLAPKDIPVPAAKFQEFFGLSYETALSEGLVYNAIDACTYLGVDAMGLDELWGSAKKVKLGGGFYCGIIEAAGKAPIYTFNAFFMSMRSKFVAPDASIHYYVVEFPASSLSWADFRGKVLGPTDPTLAPVDSLRGAILKDWEALGLGFVPNVGENSVHASASPFEGLAERMNWLQADPAADVFGAKLVKSGVPVPLIKEWSVDPQVKGKSIFDQLEDTDAAECLQKIVELSLN